MRSPAANTESTISSSPPACPPAVERTGVVLVGGRVLQICFRAVMAARIAPFLACRPLRSSRRRGGRAPLGTDRSAPASSCSGRARRCGRGALWPPPARSWCDGRRGPHLRARNAASPSPRLGDERGRVDEAGLVKSRMAHRSPRPFSDRIGYGQAMRSGRDPPQLLAPSRWRVLDGLASSRITRSHASPLRASTSRTAVRMWVTTTSASATSASSAAAERARTCRGGRRRAAMA